MAIWLLLVLSGPVKTEHVESELIAQHQSVRPGTSATVGVRLKLEPSWHVYWRNPGDSGDTVHLKWTLPDGVQAGPIQWPGPHRIMMPGDIMNHGYEGDLLLPVRISIPAGFAGKSLQLRVNAEWLVCDDSLCIPGIVDLELTLPVSADAPQPDARWTGHFERATLRLPRAAPADALKARTRGDEIVLRAELGLEEGAKLEFFPYEPNQIVHAAPQAVTRDGSATLVELKGATELKHLRGVLVVDGERTYLVDIAVTEGPSPFPIRWIGAAVLVLIAAVLILRRRAG